MRINHDGYVGIGTTTPRYPLHITSNLTNVSAGTTYYYAMDYNNHLKTEPNNTWISSSGISAYFVGSTSSQKYYVRSDRRIKTDFTLISDDIFLNKVNQLESYEYNYIDPERKRNIKTIGFIAQEVNNVIPNAVSLEIGYVPDEMRLLNDPQWSQIENDKYKLTISNFDLSGNHALNVPIFL